MGLTYQTNSPDAKNPNERHQSSRWRDPESRRLPNNPAFRFRRFLLEQSKAEAQEAKLTERTQPPRREG
jgi:hypothetical protein